MKIRVVSDLHLEFYGDREYELPIGKDEDQSILILAGDIALASKINKFRYFFEDVYYRFKKIIYICGNHEFYHNSIVRTPEKILEGLEGLTDKIIFGDNQSIEIDGVVFIYSTMWSSFDDGDVFSMITASSSMNDFRLIRTGPKQNPHLKKLKPEDVLIIHKRSVDYIFNEIRVSKDEGKKVVVITHYAPSFKLVTPRYKNSNLNGCYYSNLDSKITAYKPDLWIYGHTHSSNDIMLGDTRIVANAFGYVRHEENPEFNPEFSVEV